MEIWPALDIVEGRVVRLTRGDFDRETTYALGDALAYLQQRFGGWPPRLHLVDLSGASRGHFSLYESIQALASAGVRVQTGGGLRTLEDVRRAVDAGAERVILGSQLVRDQAFRDACLAEFPHHVVAGLDVKQGRLRVSGWRRSGPPAELFWLKLQQQGWTRAQVTDINRDGTLGGINEVFWSSWARMPGEIGAGGGIASLDDIIRLKSLGIQNAVVGKAWIEGHIPIEEVARQC